MRHRPSRWKWGHVDDDEKKVALGVYCHAERLVTLAPRLRLAKNHDILWYTLGHELVHMLHKDDGSTTQNERRAYRLEKAAGEVLHDFYHRFKGSGLPNCTGAKCRVKSKRAQGSAK